MTRLRLGHCALNKTLKIIGKHQSGLCEGCQQEEESVEHIVMSCKGYEMQREVMRIHLRDLGTQDFTLKSMLNMGDRAQVRVLIHFLRDTGVFHRI